jgi:hypothetical protein
VRGGRVANALRKTYFADRRGGVEEVEHAAEGEGLGHEEGGDVCVGEGARHSFELMCHE